LFSHFNNISHGFFVSTEKAVSNPIPNPKSEKGENSRVLDFSPFFLFFDADLQFILNLVFPEF